MPLPVQNLNRWHPQVNFLSERNLRSLLLEFMRVSVKIESFLPTCIKYVFLQFKGHLRKKEESEDDIKPGFQLLLYSQDCFR